MERVRIIADTRETYSGIPEMLKGRAEVELCQLPVGDYILSEQVAVERKRAADFLDSLVKKRIFDQVIRLKNAYEKPVLIIENEGLFERNITDRAIYGAIACILTDYEIPVIRTRDAEETASLLHAIALREQHTRRREVSLRGKRPHMELREWQQFIVEGLPNVSTVLARRLLRHFGSVANIMNAGCEQLQEVEGIGKKKAEKIREVLEEEWMEEVEG